MGIIGAIVINKIDQFIAKQQRNINLNSQIDKKNEILETQDKLIDVKIQKMAKAKETASQSMFESREQALAIISEAMTTIHHESENEDGEDNDESLSKSADDLAKLLG